MCYRAPMMKSWWNQITVRTLLTTTTIFFGAIGFPLGKKNYGKGDRTLFVWNQSSYNREVFKNGEFPDKQPTVTYGDGDGIVNKRSLEACNKWSQR